MKGSLSAYRNKESEDRDGSLEGRYMPDRAWIWVSRFPRTRFFEHLRLRGLRLNALRSLMSIRRRCWICCSRCCAHQTWIKPASRQPAFAVPSVRVVARATMSQRSQKTFELDGKSNAC